MTRSDHVKEYDDQAKSCKTSMVMYGSNFAKLCIPATHHVVSQSVSQSVDKQTNKQTVCTAHLLVCATANKNVQSVCWCLFLPDFFFFLM